MSGRDPGEADRSTSALELFFDLAFVVAVAAAASALRTSWIAGDLHGVLGYLAVFFAIWWAWVNYSWFASAYDTGDIVFRLFTFVVMAGVLVLAAGITAAAGPAHDFTVVVLGYVIMRLALVPMWFKAARDHPRSRAVATRYGIGIVIVQVLWVLRTVFADHSTLGWVAFGVLVILELAIPYVAENAGPITPWNLGHVAERYEGFTIIVLGEVILAASLAISSALDDHGLSTQLVLLIVGSLLVVFSLWWLYFKWPMVQALRPETSFVFGYVHYFLFAAIAAAGAGIGTLVAVIHDDATIASRTASMLLAGCICVYLMGLSVVHAVGVRSPRVLGPGLLSSVLLIGIAALGAAAGTTVLLLGVGLVVVITLDQYAARRQA